MRSNGSTVTSKCLQSANKNHSLNSIHSDTLTKLKEQISSNTGVYCHKDKDIAACADNIKKILEWQFTITEEKELIAAQIQTGIMVVFDTELNSHFVIISASLLNGIMKVGVRSSLNSRLTRIGMKSISGPIAKRIKDKTFLNQYRVMKRKWTVCEPSDFFNKYMPAFIMAKSEAEQAEKTILGDISNLLGDLFYDFDTADECILAEMNVGAN